MGRHPVGGLVVFGEGSQRELQQPQKISAETHWPLSGRFLEPCGAIDQDEAIQRAAGRDRALEDHDEMIDLCPDPAECGTT
jgi:hypothetical protein